MYGFNFDNEDILAVAAGIAVAAIGFAGFNQRWQPLFMLQLLLASVLVVAAREISQRTTAYLMNAYQDTELRKKGSFVSIMFAVSAVLLEAPVALIIPFSSSWEQKDYEQWGKSIDVVYPKREYWLGAMGVVGVLALWSVMFYLDLDTLATSAGVFALSQMLPLNETGFFDGRTDGAYVLLHSGFIWLLLTGLSLLTIFLPGIM